GAGSWSGARLDHTQASTWRSAGGGAHSRYPAVIPTVSRMPPAMAVSFKTASGRGGGMVAMATPDMGKAVEFLAANARVIDRRRYERLFEGGAAEPVREALGAYRTPDGGF